MTWIFLSELPKTLDDEEDDMPKIISLQTRIVDIPTVRPHKLSFGSVQQQSYCVVRIELSDGAVGWGEAATIGGASWNEESPESIWHAVNAYLSPAVLNQKSGAFESILQRMDKSCRGNYFAKSAVEMALIDAVARSQNLPAWQLLGGKLHDRLPLAWTLATGDVNKDLAEAHRKIEERQHRIFKIKIGARLPEEDVALVSAIARELGNRVRLTVDVNQAWDGSTAHRYVPELADAGVDLIEQPVAKWNIQGLASLVGRQMRTLIMADESICTPQDAFMLSKQNASNVFSLKVAKHGGLLRTRKVAAVAEASDIDWYGGTMLETSLGSAASAHVFSTLPGKHHGCELFGPQLLVDDIVETPMLVKDFDLHIPDGPGFGVTVDEKKLNRFDRAMKGLTPTHFDLGRKQTVCN
jgi:muconate cycloisomerase